MMQQSKPKLLACLIISTLVAIPVTSTAEDKLPIGIAPRPPKWQLGIEYAESREDGTWLPTPVDDEIVYRLLYLDVGYPAACQAALDAQRDVLGVTLQGQIELEQAKHRAAILEQSAKQPEGWSLWEVGLAVGSGLAVGMVAGFVAGVMP